MQPEKSLHISWLHQSRSQSSDEMVVRGLDRGTRFERLSLSDVLEFDYGRMLHVSHDIVMSLYRVEPPFHATV